MPASTLVHLLQITDSAFPTGGYAHSHGLEEIVRCGGVSDESSLLGFLQNQIRPALEHIDLPLLRDAHAAAAAGDHATLIEIDRLAGALRLPSELREASRRIGRRRLAISLSLHSNPALEALAAAISTHDAGGHHLIVFACACSHLPTRETLTAYDYQSIAGYCTAALKLLRIGQEGIQRVLTTCLAESPDAIDRALAIPSEEIGWFDPALDLASMRHEIAHERLFIS